MNKQVLRILEIYIYIYIYIHINFFFFLLCISRWVVTLAVGNKKCLECQ